MKQQVKPDPERHVGADAKCPRLLEEMGAFFDARADGYDAHMIDDMGLGEYYREIGRLCRLVAPEPRLLDLGAGTGLELADIFRHHPDTRLTAIDLSAGMLEKLKDRFPDQAGRMKLICGSYFDVPLGDACFDAVLSSMTFHHFDHGMKRTLYGKIRQALHAAGCFIYGDYMVRTVEEEHHWLAENHRIRSVQGITDGFFHYDTPFAVDTELALLRDAGFTHVEVIRQWGNTTLLCCRP